MLKMTRDDVSHFCRENYDAISLISVGVDDYIVCRCCLINDILQGLISAQQAVEKILKGYLLLKQNMDPKDLGHDLLKIKNNVDKFDDYALDDFKPLLERLQQHYATRYPDNLNQSKRMSSDELDEIDELIVYLIDNLPLPDEVKFRTGMYALLFLLKERGFEHGNSFWLKNKNKAIEKISVRLNERHDEVMKHLYLSYQQKGKR